MGDFFGDHDLESSVDPGGADELLDGLVFMSGPGIGCELFGEIEDGLAPIVDRALVVGELLQRRGGDVPCAAGLASFPRATWLWSSDERGPEGCWPAFEADRAVLVLGPAGDRED